MKVLIIGSNDKLDQILFKTLINTNYLVDSYFHSIDTVNENNFHYIDNLTEMISKNKYDVIIYTLRIVNESAEKNKQLAI